MPMLSAHSNVLIYELILLNESVVRILEKGLEETLALHRVGRFPELGVSFKTQNLIESSIARAEE